MSQERAEFIAGMGSDLLTKLKVIIKQLKNEGDEVLETFSIDHEFFTLAATLSTLMYEEKVKAVGPAPTCEAAYHEGVLFGVGIGVGIVKTKSHDRFNLVDEVSK